MLSIYFCALRSLEEATSFIAEVIFRVLRTEEILSFISLRDAIYTNDSEVCTRLRLLP